MFVDDGGISKLRKKYGAAEPEFLVERNGEDGGGTGVVNFLDLIFALFRLFSFRTAKFSSIAIAHSELSNLQNSAISGV